MQAPTNISNGCTYPQSSPSYLLLGPGADELLALGGDDADVGVGGGAVAHAPGAEAAGEGEDADDGVGPDLAGPDLEVVGATDAVDLEVVDGGGERTAGGLDGGPAGIHSSEDEEHRRVRAW